MNISTIAFLKNLKCIFVLLPFLTISSSLHTMEQEQQKYCFNDLPTEIKMIVFSFLPSVCKTQEEATTAIQAVSLTCQEHNILVNDIHFNQLFIENSLKKYTLIESAELILLLTPCKSLYMRSIDELKVIAQYAVIHHNELRLSKEDRWFPWCDSPIGGFCDAMRKSCEVIKNLMNDKDWETISQEIALEYEVKMSQIPFKVTNNYPIGHELYRITAELLFFAEKTAETIKNIFKSSSRLTNKWVQIDSLRNIDFSTKFNNQFVWQPTYFAICRISAADDVLISFIEKSKSFYEFLENSESSQ
jgi:hypothetical protein